jgi:hypothetical protein
LLTGYFNILTVIIFLIAAEIGAAIEHIILAVLGSDFSETGNFDAIPGFEIGLNTPHYLAPVIPSILISLGSIIFTGIAYFTLSGGALTVHIFEYTLMGIYLRHFPLRIVLTARILMSENLNDDTRFASFVKEIGNLIPASYILALVIWSFNLAGPESTFSVNQFSINFSVQMVLIFAGFFILFALIPFVIGTKKSKKWKVNLLERQLKLIDKFMDLISRPNSLSSVPKLTRFRDDLIAEINLFLSKLSAFSFFAEFEQKYLFNWDYITGEESERLKKYLIEECKIDWAKTAIITKNNDVVSINALDGSFSITIELNDKKTEAILTINDVTTEEFFADNSSGMTKIFPLKVVPKMFMSSFFTIIFFRYLKERDHDPRYNFFKKIELLVEEINEIIIDLGYKNKSDMRIIAADTLKAYQSRKDSIRNEIKEIKEAKSPFFNATIITIFSSLINASIIHELGKAVWEIFSKT